MRPGFDNPFAGYIWSMTAHRGRLYAGTFDSAVFALWSDPARRPEPYRRINVREFVERHGGFALWRTEDGLSWEAVTRHGFGNPYNYGARTLRSTPAGLFVGTANPFAPLVAVNEGGRWVYAPNDRGGAEIWLGG
jgi:hypothetical protein